MPTLTVKNIPEELYEQLKRSAALHRRSINSEIIVCIEKSVRSNRLSAETALARARRLREKTASYLLTDIELKRAREAGRP